MRIKSATGTVVGIMAAGIRIIGVQIAAQSTVWESG
jgi:hypothetical protein